MAENKCRLCGGETNEKDAICRICKLFRKEELTALSVIPAKAGIISKKDSGQVYDPWVTTHRAGMTKKKDSGQAGMTKKKEKIMQEKKKYPKPKCEHEGCEKYVWRDRCCMIHYKEKNGLPLGRKNKSQVSHGAPPIKKAKTFGDIGPQGGRVSEPEIKKEIKVEIKKDSKTAALAQLLYASDLLDGQLNSAIENGIIDTKIILDIRFRLGTILRGNVGIPPAEVRA